MILGFTGWPGSGKTLSMVGWGYEQFLKRPRVVYSNMTGLAFPAAVYVGKFDDLLDITDGLLLLDEAGLWLASREWASLPKDMLYKLAQVRKAGLDLAWTSQHEARVDSVLRELTMLVCRCRRFGHWTWQLWCDPVADVVDRRRLLPFNPVIAELYDSWEVIGNPHTGRGWLQAGADVRSTRVAGRIARQRPSCSRIRPGIGGQRWPWSSAGLRNIADYLCEVGGWSGHLEEWSSALRVYEARHRWLRLFKLQDRDVPWSIAPWSPWAVAPPQEAVEREAEGQRLRMIRAETWFEKEISPRIAGLQEKREERANQRETEKARNRSRAAR